MSLNIKNEVVHDLVRQAAARTGKSQTSVVEAALRAYLDDLHHEEGLAARRTQLAESLATFDQVLATLDSPDLSTDFLYDENGLPA